MQERLAREKRSSLLRKSVNQSCKELIGLAPDDPGRGVAATAPNVFEAMDTCSLRQIL